MKEEEEKEMGKTKKTKRELVPFFTCSVCGKKFRGTIIGGIAYAVKNEHFRWQGKGEK